MRKTASQIESDIFVLLTASSLKNGIGGTIYKEGMRPIGATTEDAVITFVTGLDAQIQTGSVNINVYVPDIDNKGKLLVKNITRCRAVEAILQGIFEDRTPTEYKFSLGATIQTFKAEGINQHFVNAKLKFKLSTF